MTTKKSTKTIRPLVAILAIAFALVLGLAAGASAQDMGVSSDPYVGPPTTAVLSNTWEAGNSGVADPGSVSTSAQSAESLAFSGGDAAKVALFAGGLVLIGGVAIALQRRSAKA